MAEIRTVKIEINDYNWVEFKKAALEDGNSVQELLGLCVIKFLADRVLSKGKEGKNDHTLHPK